MITDVQLTPESWLNFWRYYKDEPQQQEAIEMLRQFINEADPTLLTNNAAWVHKYREKKEPSVPRLTPSAPFDQLVTEHFSYGELTLGQEARRFINQGQCDIAVELCQFLEDARSKFGPLKITSGHRPPDVNASVGGATNSEHLFQPGCGAVDVYPVNGDGMAFERWVDVQWPFSVGYGMKYRQFVHIGIRAGRPRLRWEY